MDLSQEELKIINMLFDNIFSLEDRKRLLLQANANLHIDFALNGANSEKIYKMFDSAFKLEHKIQAIELNYLTYGYKFKDIHELIKNRDVLIYNHYDSSWRNKRANRFNRYSYC